MPSELDDTIDDFPLPDELAALGEQLTTDAMFLAARYPATAVDNAADRGASKATEPGLTLAQRRLWSSKRLVLTYSVLAAAISFLLAVPMARHLWHDGDGPADVAVIDEDRSDEDRSDEDRGERNLQDEDSETNRAAVADLVSSELELTPVYLLQEEASSPEMEGLLDLMEYEEQGQTTLSL